MWAAKSLLLLPAYCNILIVVKPESCSIIVIWFLIGKKKKNLPFQSSSIQIFLFVSFMSFSFLLGQDSKLFPHTYLPYLNYHSFQEMDILCHLHLHWNNTSLYLLNLLVFSTQNLCWKIYQQSQLSTS